MREYAKLWESLDRRRTLIVGDGRKIGNLRRAVQLGPLCPPRLILIATDALALVLIWFAGLWGFAVHANNRRAASVLMTLGLLMFVVLFIHHAALSNAMLGFTVTAVGTRLGLRLDHFLYDH